MLVIVVESQKTMGTWYYARNDQQAGPITGEDLHAMIARGEITRDVLVWTEGMAQWEPAATLQGVQWPAQQFVPQMSYQPVLTVSYAGFWKRVAAAIIDWLVMFIPAFLIGAVLGFVVGLIMGGHGASQHEIELTAGVLGQIAGSIMNWLYFALMESSSKQATLGKMALGIVVTDGNGNRISFGRASGRYWGKIVSALILGIGYIMAGFTEKKQALHDMMAGCLVIDKR